MEVLNHAGHDVTICPCRLSELPARSIEAQYVLHIAGALRNRKDELYAANVAGTRSLIAACKGRPQIVFLSSRAVYGTGMSGEALTEDADPRPIDDYGTSKLLGEQLVRASGLSYVILRSSLLYGVGIENRGRSFINRMIESALALGEIDVYNGHNFVDPIYVWEVANCIAGLIREGLPWNEVFNISGDHYRLGDVAHQLSILLSPVIGARCVVNQHSTGVASKPVLDSSRLFGVRTHERLDMEHILNELIYSCLQRQEVTSQ